MKRITEEWLKNHPSGLGDAMDKILINIKDKTKAHIVVSLLKELPFIEFREIGKAKKTVKKSNFRELFGIWKGRNVTLDNLRQEAWQRKIS